MTTYISGCFLGLPIDQPAPDHSTFSRFRSRLSKAAITQINSALLNQFHANGLSINEGVAIDARLIKSASRPIYNDKIKEFKDQQITPEAQLDKNGNVKKLSRDLNSDWGVKNDTPHYGIKEHAAVDVDNGFVLSTNITRLLIMTQPVCRMRPPIVCISMPPLISSMPTRAMPVHLIATFFP